MIVIALVVGFFKLIGSIFRFTIKYPILAILAVLAFCTLVAVQMVQVGG